MSTAPVTDLELMLYVDGELDESRRAAVEEELRNNQRARDLVASLGKSGALIREHAEQRAIDAKADLIVANVMARLRSEPAGNVIPMRAASPLGQARGLWYAVGGLAAAAAAALVIWKVAGPGLAPQTSIHSPAPSTALVPLGTEVASAHSPAPDVDPEPTVSVDAVDFGARTGTIFYVPADKGTTTTIVWLSDDESGGM